MSRIIDTIRRDVGDERRAESRGAGTPPEDAAAPVLGAVSYFHMNDHAAVERVVETLPRLGIRHLRTGVSWCDATRAGGAEWYEWVLSRLLEHFHVMPCVLYTPPELGVVPKTSSPPRDPDDYAAFIDHLLTTYPDRFTHVELWNEPNNYIEWDWTIDPEWKIFAQMISAASQTAHRHSAKVVLGGMSPFDPNWLDLMYRRGAMSAVDVIGVHGFPGTWEAVWEGWPAQIAKVREVVERHGHDAQLWITECGYSTWNHDEFRMLLELVDVAAAPVERVYWYSARDLDPSYETLDGFHCDERAYHFGLFHLDGTPKLPARAWMRSGLDGLRTLAEIGTESRHDHPQRPTLITGGAGFVGTNLADRICSDGKPVVILDNLSRPGVEQNLTWLKEKHGNLVGVEIGDVRDRFAIRRALTGCDGVFHLAAQVAVTTSLMAPPTDAEINLNGTINVLEEVRRIDDPPPILFTSTNKVYGGLSDFVLDERETRYEPRDEAVAAYGVGEGRPLQFCSPYGCSKGAADQYVLDYAASFGLRTSVFRMSCVYGPHQFGNEDQGWLAHFLIQAVNGDGITIYGDGKQVRDLLFVDDLVEAMLAAIGDEAAIGRAFNIGGGVENAVSLLEVLSLVEEVHGSAPKVAYAPWRVADQRYYVSDITSFHEIFGWKPRTSVQEGVRFLMRWLSDNRVKVPRDSSAAR